MNYQIIQNKSTSTKSIFNSYIKGAEIVYIASAFIDDFSIDFIKEILALSRADRPQIKFLTGLFGRFNRKKNLVELQKLNEKQYKFLEIKISVKPEFHWKYYAFKRKNTFTFLIGSANFTKNGFNSQGEFLLQFLEEVKSFSNSKLYTMFSNEFENAINIDEIDLTKYIERKKNIETGNDNRVFNLLKNIQSKDKIDPKKLCRIIKFQFPLDKKVKKKLYEQKSGWANNNWDPFSFQNKKDFNAALKSKYLLNIYRLRSKYYMELCEIKDNDSNLLIGNEHYFVATEFRKKMLITEKKKKELDEINLLFRTHHKNWKEIYSNKKTNELIENWFSI